MKGILLTPAQRQQIVDLRRAGHTYKQVAKITRHPYNTVAGICRDAGLQKESKKIVTLIRDPAGIFEPGPVEWNQCDLAAMLELSEIPDGFTLTIGRHRIQVQDGIFVRDDGARCPPNHSSALKWYKPQGVE